MSRLRCRWSVVGCIVAAAATAASGQTVINGNALALQSSGSASGNSWTLDSDGYVGTYITLASPTAVNLTASAADGNGQAAAPDLTFSIANDSFSQLVSSTTGSNVTYTTPVLPAGTYFVRTQLDNSATPTTDTNLTSLTSASSNAPSLAINSLTVAGSGVSVSNTNSSANALAAANTYSSNFRSGAATVHLMLPGGQAVGANVAAHVQLTSNAFNFALAVQGQSQYYQPPSWLNYNASTGQYIAPTPGSTAAIYQQHLLQNFNMIVPANAGKWQNDEYTQGQPTMQIVDAMSQFAAQNNLGVRMHNLVWWDQQPSYVNNLFGTTNNNTPSAANLSAIQSAVSSRIGYYVSGTNPNLGTPRADSYAQLDVLNEPVHSDLNSVTDSYNFSTQQTTYNNDHYQQYLGINGVAQIYSQVASALAAAGANTKLYTNEYNVVSNSANPMTNGNDPYANWYLNEVTQLNSTQYGKVVTGVGAELYTSYTAANASTGSLVPSTIMQSLQNLSVAGDPISITEFSDSPGYGTTPTAQAFANDLTTALTIAYGNPNVNTMGFWGGLGGPVDANSITSLYDANWNLTVVGQAYQAFMQQYDTSLNLTTNGLGNLNFTGTYGTYEATINGQLYQFTIAPGDSSVTLTVVPEPTSVALLIGVTGGLLARRLRH